MDIDWFSQNYKSLDKSKKNISICFHPQSAIWVATLVRLRSPRGVPYHVGSWGDTLMSLGGEEIFIPWCPFPALPVLPLTDGEWGEERGGNSSGLALLGEGRAPGPPGIFDIIPTAKKKSHTNPCLWQKIKTYIVFIQKLTVEEIYKNDQNSNENVELGGPLSYFFRLENMNIFVMKIAMTTVANSLRFAWAYTF